MKVKTYWRFLPPTLALGLVTGCALGPNFETPKLAPEASYTSTASEPTTASSNGLAGAAQRFSSGADIPAEWWALFHSPALDALIRQALVANPDLQAATAALRQAQELATAQGGVLYPQVSGQLNDSRSESTGITFGLPASASSIYSLANAQVSVSYVLDVFGGERRSIEAAEATARYQAYQRDATYLSLTANLVTAAIQDASLRGQIDATKEIIDEQEHQLNVVTQQLKLGGAARADVLAQEANLAQTRATLPALQKQLAQSHNEIAALAGKFPGEDVEEGFSLATLELPSDLPLSLPADLVRQRPDVQAAEENLHKASAEVGVAIANEFPQFSLSASYGRQSAGLSNLLNHSGEVWSLGGALTQPIFQGGQLLHERRAAEAGLEQAAAQYRSAVLAAFRNVADALRAIESDANALNAEVEAERSASESLALSRQQYRLGSINYLTLLNAERAEQEAKIALVQAQAARFADTAALFQALGGGWWNRAELKSASTD